MATRGVSMEAVMNHMAMDTVLVRLAKAWRIIALTDEGHMGTVRLLLCECPSMLCSVSSSSKEGRSELVSMTNGGMSSYSSCFTDGL